MNKSRNFWLWTIGVFIFIVILLCIFSFIIQPHFGYEPFSTTGEIIIATITIIGFVIRVLTGIGILPIRKITDWSESPIYPISKEELIKRRSSVTYVNRGNLDTVNLFKNHRIAIIGEQGIGKSRETIEFLLKGIEDQNFSEEHVFELFNLKTFDEKSVEHLLLKHHHKDCSLALLIDNFHTLCQDSDLEKLEKLLVTLGSGKALYVFLSARIDLITQKQNEWLAQENNFETILLHGFDLDAFKEYVTHLDECKGLVFEPGVERFILNTTGGIPELIHIGIKSLTRIESKQISMKIAGEVIPKSLKDAWSGFYRDIYRKHSQTKYLLQALSAFQAAEMPYFTALVMRYGEYLWKIDQNAQSKYHRENLKQALDFLTNFGLQYNKRRIRPRDYMVEKEPNREACVERLGQYFLKARKGRTRRRSFLRGSDLYADAFWVLGDYYRFQEEWDYSNKYYSASIFEKKTSSTLNNRGLTYQKMGKYKEALLDYGEALKLDPKKVEAYVNRGSTYAKMGKYEEALLDYGEALRLNPTDAGIYYNIACLYALQNEASKTCEWLEKAIDLDMKYLKMSSEDSDFDGIRESEVFKALMRKYEKK